MPELVQEGRRRLSTILAADIAGYSRMMGSNEVYTTALVKKHRRERIDPTVQEYSGRIVKNTGDGFRAEFQSPVEAVKWWGNQMVAGMAYCRGCGDPSFNPRHAIKVGSFPPNGFGVYDISGGVSEWVADCWHKDYSGAPHGGAAWEAVDCQEHVLRGGSWMNDASYLRTSNRDKYDTNVRYPTHGFRIARDE